MSITSDTDPKTSVASPKPNDDRVSKILLSAGIPPGDAEARELASAFLSLAESGAPKDVVKRAVEQWRDYAAAAPLAHALGQRPSVFVIGGALMQPGTPEFLQAENLGYELSLAGFIVVHGGGPGAMEAVASGAKRAAAENPDAAPSIGFALRMATEQTTSPSLEPDRQVLLNELTVRQWMAGRATHVVALPGGWGTLYEQAEHLLNKGRLGKPGMIIHLNPPGDSFWNESLATNVTTLSQRGFLRQGEHLVPLIARSEADVVDLLTGHHLLHDRWEWSSDRQALRVFQPQATPLTPDEIDAFTFYYQQLRADLPADSPARNANAVVHGVHHPLGPHIEIATEAKHTHIPSIVISALTHAANARGIEHSYKQHNPATARADGINPLNAHLPIFSSASSASTASTVRDGQSHAIA